MLGFIFSHLKPPLFCAPLLTTLDTAMHCTWCALSTSCSCVLCICAACQTVTPMYVHPFPRSPQIWSVQSLFLYALISTSTWTSVDNNQCSMTFLFLDFLFGQMRKSSRGGIFYNWLGVAFGFWALNIWPDKYIQI